MRGQYFAEKSYEGGGEYGKEFPLADAAGEGEVRAYLHGQRPGTECRGICRKVYI